MPYITKGDIQNYMLQDIDTSFDSWIATVIEMVETYIDGYCGTSFNASGSSDYYYDGSGTDVLIIDPIQTISGLTIYDSQGNQEMTLTENVDYWLYPLNEDVKTIIKLAAGKLGHFPERTRVVKVTVVGGYADVPADIKLVALKLAAKILEKGLKGGQVSSESLGEYSVNYEKVDEAADALGINEVLDGYAPISI